MTGDGSDAASANKALIERLYTALGDCNGAAMTACYAAGAHFRDPAFGDLEGDRIGGMWRMLTARAKDLEVELRSHDADADSGSAHWIARYTFGATGRPVVNDIQARFRFADGLIVDHVDEFNIRKWAAQALGPAGNLVAVVPPLRNKIRGKALTDLDAFIRDETSSSI